MNLVDESFLRYGSLSLQQIERFLKVARLAILYHKSFNSGHKYNLVCLFKRYFGLDVIFAKDIVKGDPGHIKQD